MISLKRIRQYVRQVAVASRPYGCTEESFRDQVAEMASMPRGEIDLTDLRDAIEWNVGENYLRRYRDDEAENYLWKATPKAIAHES